MKKLLAWVVSLAMILSLCSVATFTVSAGVDEPLDLITKITNGSDISDPTEITDTGDGFVIDQSGGWNVWVLHFDENAASFAEEAGETLYLVYDMTLNGTGHLCVNGWSNSVAAAIAAAQNARTTPADDGTPMLTEGTYTGMIRIDPSVIGQTGRLGIVGYGATIRSFKLASISPDESSEDLNGGFYDDFSDGLDPDRWYICTRGWGGATNGNLPENVGYTADGELVLTAHGDLYEGTIGGKTGSRTGAVILTKETLGPGSYEVKMKASPRFGTCTAMWTFFWSSELENHEIDIEIPASTTTFKQSQFVTWTTEYNDVVQQTVPGFYHNDGEWHTYRFDWHTDPQKVDFYIDGQYETTLWDSIPTIAGNLWLGVWLPNGWCGEADFETAHMLVDYVKYKPFNEPYQSKSGDYGAVASKNQYPQEPMELPINNFVANGSFDHKLSAWTTSGNVTCVAGDDGKALSLNTASSTATQRISSVNPGGRYRVTADAMVKNAGDRATLTIEALGSNKTSVLDTNTISFNQTSFSTKNLDVTLPSGAAYVRLTMSGSAGSVFDHLYLTQPNRGEGLPEPFEPSEEPEPSELPEPSQEELSEPSELPEPSQEE